MEKKDCWLRITCDCGHEFGGLSNPYNPPKEFVCPKCRQIEENKDRDKMIQEAIEFLGSDEEMPL